MIDDGELNQKDSTEERLSKREIALAEEAEQDVDEFVQKYFIDDASLRYRRFFTLLDRHDDKGSTKRPGGQGDAVEEKRERYFSYA